MDTVEVKLPSGITAIVRNYTTRKDDAKANAFLSDGVSRDGDGNLVIPASNAIKYSDSYVYSLTQSINGNPNGVDELIDNLRSTDYEVLKDKVSEIVEANSPKAKEAEEASKPNTTAK